MSMLVYTFIQIYNRAYPETINGMNNIHTLAIVYAMAFAENDIMHFLIHGISILPSLQQDNP